MRYILLSFLLLGGCSLFYSERPLPDTTKHHIIVSVDRTKSIALSDPKNLGIDFAGVLSTLLPPYSFISALVMGKRQRVLLKTREISSKSDRMKVEKYLRKEPLSGRVFDCAGALSEAARLAEAKPSAKPSFVFISDGYNKGSPPPNGVLKQFSKKKWAVNTVAVTPKKRLPIMSSISAKTDGTLIRPESISEFFPFLMSLYPNWRLFRAFPEVGAPPHTFPIPYGTYRLFIITRRGTNNAYLKEATFAGGKRRISRSSRYVSAYPYRADRTKSVFDVVNIEAPPAGLCRLSFSSKPQEYAVWALLPVSVKVKPLTPSYNEGEDVTVRVTISADNKEAEPLLRVLRGANLDVRIVSVDGVTAPLSLNLSPVRNEKAKKRGKKRKSTRVLTYEDRVRVYLRKRADERFMLVVRASLRYPKYTLWLCEQEQEFLVKVAKVPVEVEPSEISFAPSWIDEPPAPIELRLWTEYPHSLKLSVKDTPNWLSVKPKEASLSRGREASFVVSVNADPKAIAGRRSGAITFNLRTEDGSDFAELSIPVSATLLKLNLRKNVKTLLHPGREFDTELGEPMEPSIPLEMKVEMEKKSRIKPLMLYTKGGKLYLHVWVDEDAKDERTLIRLSILPKGYKVSPKRVVIDALVRAAPRLKIEPSKITLKVDKEGEYEIKVKVTAEHYEELELETSVSDLVGKGKHRIVAEAGEVRTVEKATLRPDETYELNLYLLISPDLHNGVYKGETTLLLRYHKGERQLSFKIPIELEIKR